MAGSRKIGGSRSISGSRKMGGSRSISGSRTRKKKQEDGTEQDQEYDRRAIRDNRVGQKTYFRYVISATFFFIFILLNVLQIAKNRMNQNGQKLLHFEYGTN